MVYTPMMYGGGMNPEVRENRRKRSLLGTEGSGKSPPSPFFWILHLRLAQRLLKVCST
jgi:hypothetical protein